MSERARPFFPGFPDGRLRFTPVPDVFFSELLPAADDLAELKVTLHCLWRLQRLKREPRCLSLSDLRADGALLAGLDPEGTGASEILDEALARAVTRGALLRLADAESGEAWFFLNSEQGRHAFAEVQRGQAALRGSVPGSEPSPAVGRPNIFKLYEQNIGLLQPLIADQLRDAESTYPDDWIAEAFRIAVEQNVRNWAYVRRILERWAQEGKDSGPCPQGDPSRYVRGKYADRIQH